MKQNRVVAEAVAGLAAELVPVLIEDKSLPLINTEAAAREVISFAVTQDRNIESKRFWAAVVLALGSAIEAYNGDWKATLFMALPGLLVALSKYLDPRPTSMA